MTALGLLGGGAQFALSAELPPVLSHSGGDLTAEARHGLAAWARYLTGRSGERAEKVVIAAHTDVRCTSAYCLGLGQRIGERAARLLIEQGVAAERIGVISYGKERALCDEATPHCDARNRRIEISVQSATSR